MGSSCSLVVLLITCFFLITFMPRLVQDVTRKSSEPHSNPAEALVVHEDALGVAYQAASRSIDQLIWQSNPDVAKSVTLFGPGIVVLPLFGKISGVDDQTCLTYSAHPKRAARSGLMDRVDFETKFGQLDPGRLVEELASGKASLDDRLRSISDSELRDEVAALQDWREKAYGLLKTLEKRQLGHSLE